MLAIVNTVGWKMCQNYNIAHLGGEVVNHHKTITNAWSTDRKLRLLWYVYVNIIITWRHCHVPKEWEQLEFCNSNFSTYAKDPVTEIVVKFRT